MSKMIMVCFRDVPKIDSIVIKLKKMNERLMPDNIMVTQPNIICSDKKLIMAVYGTNSTVEYLPGHKGLCLGKVFEGGDTWHEPGSFTPDGTYALVRSNERYVEAVTDTVASRTIWYYIDHEKWIVSTSQRAIIMLLGSFELNEKVIPWMLSAGNLGFNNSWDKRIKCLPSNSVASLNRCGWDLKITTKKIDFNPLDLPNEEHESRLENAIEETMNNIQFKPDQWVLPLSGGYDSRALLLFFKEKYDIETITWGTKDAQNQRYSDAQIAKELTEKLGIKNTYFALDNVQIEPKKILNRFIQNGEGRIDHISGYMDGFDLWSSLSYRTEGIIRGDEMFGWVPATNDKDVRRIVGFSLWSDYDNLPAPSLFELQDNSLQNSFTRFKDETIDTYRDRLYQELRLPIVLASLNDLKTAYVEIMNPLLSKKIIEVIKALPDHLRNNKQLFRQIVNKYSPPVPYAKYSANQKKENIMRAKSMIEVLVEEIIDNGDIVFSDTYLTFIMDKLTNERGPVNLKTYLKKTKSWLSPYISKNIKKHIRNHVTKQNMDYYLLAFRTVIIIKMNQLLREDEKFLK